jgi:hypothetical protein
MVIYSQQIALVDLIEVDTECCSLSSLQLAQNAVGNGSY